MGLLKEVAKAAPINGIMLVIEVMNFDAVAVVAVVTALSFAAFTAFAVPAMPDAAEADVDEPGSPLVPSPVPSMETEAACPRRTHHWC